MSDSDEVLDALLHQVSAMRRWGFDAVREHAEQRDLMRQALADAESRAARAEAELDAIRTSTSWRATAPLRGVAGRLRGRS